MGGSINFHKPAGRWYVQVYWQGQRVKIWRYKEEPIWHEKTAEKLLDRIRTEIDDGTFNPRHYLPDSPLSLKVYSEQWLKASQACENTKRVYRSCMKKVIENFGGDCDIRKITHTKLLIFYNELPLTEKGKYNVLNALKTMLNYAVKDDVLIRIPPFPALKNDRPDHIDYLTFDQQRKVLEVIPERHRPIFEFAMEYGLRIQEARALMKDCITDQEVIIRRSFSEFKLRETTKTGRIRRFSLTSRARSILKSMPLSTCPFVFTSNNKTAYHPRLLNEIWHKACAEVGIKIKLYNAFRHSLGCQLLDEGQPLDLVRDILGHSTSEMTRRYAKRNPIQLTNALENRGKVMPFRGHLEVEK